MLDFYHTEDDTPRHNKLSKDEFLGGIDYAEFDELQNKRIIEAHLDFYKDFRWTNEQVNSKLKLLLADPNGRDYKLTGILKKATELNRGIIANSD